MAESVTPKERRSAREPSLSEVFERVGKEVCRLDYYFQGDFRGMYEFRGLSLRPPQTIGGEWLVTVKGFEESGAPVIAFHSALGAGEALAGAMHRFGDGTLKWKEDRYA